MLAHYRINRQIGEGGMGAVYRAEDTKLRRTVALKVLPAEMAANSDRLARFQREARAVAALNHPHIVTLFSVEEDRGTHFLTMELVEGESLDCGLPPDGLPLAQVFDIGVALADALVAAHEKGIVHRDLKPANVMVTKDKRIKVLDFGLAKLVAKSDPPGAAGGAGGVTPTSAPTVTHGRDDSLTATGMMMGTLPYMSPEQLSGESVDTRTDIFSLGVVLYELATGRRPFRGKNTPETISAIMRDAPQPVAEARQDAPRQLGRIIDHCLKKMPRDRFQTALDVFNELRDLRKEAAPGTALSDAEGTTPASGKDSFPPASTPSGVQTGAAGSRLWPGAIAGAAAVVALVAAFWLGTRKGDETAPSGDAAGGGHPTSAVAVPETHSIAVLPFADMSPNKDQEYFSDGISEELLNLLAKIPQLRVTSRSSAFSFKGQDLEMSEIARRLNVAHILEGSVRKADNQVRITAQLIEAGSDTQLWSETYSRTLDDIFAIQHDIATDVVTQLKVTLLGETPRARETDPEAYALYLEARHLSRLRKTAEGYEKAMELYQQAVGIDPDYAAAWDGLATVYINQAGSGLRPLDEGYRLAREAIRKALAIDPDFAQGHSSLGWMAMFYDGDLATAARHYERALELDPSNSQIVRGAAVLATSLGRLDQAIALGEYVVARDPFDPIGHANLGISYCPAGRWDESIASYRTALTLSPNRIGAQYGIGTALLLKGDAEAALAAMQKESFEVYRLLGQVMAHHALGLKAESDAALAKMIEKYEQDWPYDIAYLLAYRGEVDRAFAWLHKAVEYNDPGLYGITTELLFANLHADPRWLRLLEELGKSPEQLAAIEFQVTLPE
jgi:serine/threonine protein kinase/TolB-like protein/cytochrome c-type biogenesis protein CcmH/NrfG